MPASPRFVVVGQPRMRKGYWGVLDTTGDEYADANSLKEVVTTKSVAVEIAKRLNERHGRQDNPVILHLDRVTRLVVNRAVNPARKDPAVMTAGEINRELDRLDKVDWQITEELFAAGRGDERGSETLAASDPLARRYQAASEARWALREEVERRYGPGPPRRLPKGFGPIRGRGRADNPRQRLTDVLLSEHIDMPGFPQLIVTRAFAYKWLKSTGSSKEEADYLVFSKAVTQRPLTDSETRDEWLAQIRRNPRVSTPKMGQDWQEQINLLVRAVLSGSFTIASIRDRIATNEKTIKSWFVTARAWGKKPSEYGESVVNNLRLENQARREVLRILGTMGIRSDKDVEKSSWKTRNPINIRRAA